MRTVTPTDPEGFEQAVEEPETLAVCLFSRQWMTDFLAKGGLRVTDFAAYHFQNEHDAERDPADNEDPEKLKEARDAFYICLPFEAGRAGEGQAHIPVAAGKISFMQFYNLEEGPVELSSAQAAESSQEPDPLRDRVRQDFKTAEDFLYGGNLHFPARRFFFTDCAVGLGDIPISASHAVVSVYPESSLCQVTVCLQVEETSIQNFVYLHQIQCGETAPFTVNGEPCAIPLLCERLMARCGLKTRSKGPTSIITEINRLDGRDSYGPLTDNECRCLYGALTGDEGWAHVPVELARGRIDNSWTSRDFVRAIVFSSNYLLLNLNRDKRYEEYLRWQHGYADHYFGGLNDYFTMDAATAGINHGLFLSVETGMLIKATADRLLDRKPDLTRHSCFFLQEEIRKNKRYRREMIETLNKVEMVNISELGELDALIVRSLGVTQKIDSIRGLLELLESDLDLAYQTKTNQMVNLLTILSVGLAAVQVILALIIM